MRQKGKRILNYLTKTERIILFKKVAVSFKREIDGFEIVEGVVTKRQSLLFPQDGENAQIVGKDPFFPVQAQVVDDLDDRVRRALDLQKIAEGHAVQAEQGVIQLPGFAPFFVNLAAKIAQGEQNGLHGVEVADAYFQFPVDLKGVVHRRRWRLECQGCALVLAQTKQTFVFK